MRSLEAGKMEVILLKFLGRYTTHARRHDDAGAIISFDLIAVLVLDFRLG
jgi:hypothetical protein